MIFIYIMFDGSANVPSSEGNVKFVDNTLVVSNVLGVDTTKGAMVLNGEYISTHLL